MAGDVERIAQAIYATWLVSYSADPPWDELEDRFQEPYRRAARAVVAVLPTLGYVRVADAIAAAQDEKRIKHYWIGGLTQYTKAVSVDDLADLLKRLGEDSDHA